MPITRLSSPTLLISLAAILAAAGAPRSVLADDDDKKLLSRKPAVVAQPYHNSPDPWKLLSRLPAVPGGTDDTFQTRNVTLQAWLPLNSFAGFVTPGAWGSPNGADCWGYTSPSGREYALMGLSWGNGIVEITNPTNPQIITVISGGLNPAVNFGNQLWRDITVIGNYAYAGSDNGGVGIQVIDLSQIDSGVVTLVRNYSQGGHTTSHTILSNPTSGFLYATGGNIAGGGFKPLSLSPHPTFPTFTAFPWTTSYVHEALIDTYTSGPYAGKEIAFLFRGSSSNRISIVDITNKAAAGITLSSITYPGANYSHQGWLSLDKKYLYHNDEIDGPNQSVPYMLTRVFDVTNLSAPRLVSTFTNGLPAVDHNEYTTGRYLFQSNYSSGMHVWDLYNPLKPVEVAWIDTRPEDGYGTGVADGSDYNGAWGNYPYFASGNILISDLERGLFVVKLSLLELSLPSPAPVTLIPGQPTPVSLQIVERGASAGAVSLLVSVNGGAYSAIPMDAQGGGLYAASIPPQNVFARIRYVFEAQTLDPAPRYFAWPMSPTGGAPITAYAQTGQTTLFSDNFQTDQLWTIQNTGITAGAWVRATPLFNAGPGAVIGDADGSGMCFVTGNTANADVTGGTTRLLSPVLNLAAAPEARISYSRWLCSLVGTVDSLITEISGDNGTNWIQVSTVSPVTGGWEAHAFRVADFITPTAQTRVRFSVANTDTSTTEAGIDAFTVISPTGATCYANCDGSTTPPILNVNDFSCFLNRFSVGDTYTNCDNSTQLPVLNILDFACYLNQFAAGCP